MDSIVDDNQSGFLDYCMGFKMTAQKVLLIIFILAGCSDPEGGCYSGHTVTVQHQSYTQFIYIGKTMSPIFHPAHDSEELICDETMLEHKIRSMRKNK